MLDILPDTQILAYNVLPASSPSAYLSLLAHFALTLPVSGQRGQHYPSVPQSSP